MNCDHESTPPSPTQHTPIPVLYHTTQHHTTPHYTTLNHTTLHYTTPNQTTQQHTKPHHTTPTTSQYYINLYACMRAEVEVELVWVCDAVVDGGACGNVTPASVLVAVLGAEEPGVVSLLHCHKADARLWWWWC